MRSFFIVEFISDHFSNLFLFSVWVCRPFMLSEAILMFALFLIPFLGGGVGCVGSLVFGCGVVFASRGWCVGFRLILLGGCFPWRGFCCLGVGGWCWGVLVLWSGAWGVGGSGVVCVLWGRCVCCLWLLFPSVLYGWVGLMVRFWVSWIRVWQVTLCGRPDVVGLSPLRVVVFVAWCSRGGLSASGDSVWCVTGLGLFVRWLCWVGRGGIPVYRLGWVLFRVV
jgi:hypothetical protein